MLTRSLLAAGALAWQASAFLIPLEVSREAGIAQANKELKHQVVDLDCPSCPFAGADGDGSIWTQEHKPVNIHLEFDITDDDQFLQINGQPVFPPPKTLIPIALKAAEIRTSDQSQTQALRLGYALEVLPTSSEVTDISLTPIQFTVLDLEGIPVEVDTVRIDLIQSWGRLHIARVSQLPFADSPGANQCQTSICRLRAIVAHRIRQMIEAAKSHAGKAKTWIKNACPGRNHGQAAGAQRHGRYRHHAHHRHSRLRQFLRQTLHSFIIPALFGVCGGLLACGLGMCVGRALAYSLHRVSRDAAARRREAAVEEDEKDALVENGEMPPQYEDVEVIVIEKK